MDADEFNAAYPIGTRVYYWPGARHPSIPGRPSWTRTPAWCLGGHTDVVTVEGYPGGIALTHIEIAEEATP